jgi:hypothetical protein
MRIALMSEAHRPPRGVIGHAAPSPSMIADCMTSAAALPWHAKLSCV